jgi:hypothetical protein
VEQFEVLVTLDTHTCGACGDHDHRHYDMKDFEIGVTAPPFHPNCRCTTSPFFDDEEGYQGERTMRKDDKSKTEYVPKSMTYEEWKEQYVDNGELKEKSLRKGSGDYAVNWKTVKSKEYSARFGQLSGSDKANSLVAQKCRNALANRTGKNTEELYGINLTKGTVVSSITDQNIAFAVKRSTKFDSDMLRAEKSGDDLLLVHNHPRGMPPSVVDINELLSHKNTAGIVAGHNGSIYYYTRPNKAITDYDFSIALRHNMNYTDDVTRYEKALELLSERFGFTFRIM